MFEFDAGKFVLIAIVALIVIGPKELPRVMRQLGQAVGRLKRLSSEFQSQFMEAMREADLHEVQAEAAKIAAAARLDHGIDPLAGIRAELTKSIEETPSSDSVATAMPVSPDPLAEALQSDPEAAGAHIAAREPMGEPLTIDPIEPVPVTPVIVESPPTAEVAVTADADITPLRKQG
jgi:sec-independent protein translocase protein TatB